MMAEPGRKERSVSPGNADRWGEPVMKFGFAAVPNLLLRHQRDLEISPVEMCVLLQVYRYWWFSDRPPFPTVAQLERALPVKKRTIQRALRSLADKGLLIRRPAGPRKRPEYDFSGLRERLEEYARSAAGVRIGPNVPSPPGERFPEEAFGASRVDVNEILA